MGRFREILGGAILASIISVLITDHLEDFLKNLRDELSTSSEDSTSSDGADDMVDNSDDDGVSAEDFENGEV